MDKNKDPNALPRVLRIDDLSKILDRSRRSVDRLRRRGALPDPLNIPGRPCWAPDTIKDWMAGGGTGRRRGR